MADPIIQVENISKVYNAPGGRTVEAVNDVSFEVGQREIFGLLGPNGAGKSTTIGMLTTTVVITGGKAAIAGHDVASDPIGVKKTIAVVPQSVNLDRSLTARENLLFHSNYFGIPKAEGARRADELLELMALTDRSWDYPADLSGGMARRLQIARALMHNPEVLFLDEATTGLDPQSRLMIWHKVRELNEAGQTVVLTTHYMEEADQLCDRVAVLDKGRVLALDKPSKLKEMIPGGNVVELKTTEHCAPLEGWLRHEITGLHKVECEDNTLRLYLSRPEDALVRIVETVRRHGVALESVQLHPVTLEDVFMHLTGKGLRE